MRGFEVKFEPNLKVFEVKYMPIVALIQLLNLAVLGQTFQFLHLCANMLVKRKSIKILYECPFEIMAIGRKGFAGHALPALKRTIVEYLKKNAEWSTKYSY